MASLKSDCPQAVQGPHSNWVVQKFGGTSVGKFSLNIVEKVVQYGLLFICATPDHVARTPANVD